MKQTTSSKQYNQNKYRLLDDDKTSFAGNRCVTSHTVEVSTLGIVSDTKVFTSAIKLPDVPASLWHSVACQALSTLDALSLIQALSLILHLVFTAQETPVTILAQTSACMHDCMAILI